MFETFAFYALPFTFTLLVACALTCLACGIFLLLFRIRATNEAMRHPYLDKHPWERYPLSIRAAIFMDYFLRIAFPKSSFWIIGQANRLLARSEEHTSELQSLMRISYAVFCLKKKTIHKHLH